MQYTPRQEVEINQLDRQRESAQERLLPDRDAEERRRQELIDEEIAR